MSDGQKRFLGGVFIVMGLMAMATGASTGLVWGGLGVCLIKGYL